MAELSGRRRYAAVMGLIGSGHAVSHFYLLALPPLFPLLKEEFGVGYVELGLLVSLFNITSGAFQLPVGIAVDRVGARVLLGSGLALMGLCFAGIALAPTYWVVAVLVFIAGIGNSVFHPADYAIINATVEEGRLGRAFGMHTFTGNLGFTAAPATMILLASLLGWRGAVFSAAMLSIIVVGLLIAFGGLLRDERDAARQNSETPTAAKQSNTAILFSPPILMMFMFYVFASMASSGMQTFSVAALVDHQGLGLGTATMLLTVFLVSGAAGVLLGGPLADRTKRHGMTAAAAMAISAGLIALVGGFSMPVAMIAVLFCLFGLLQGCVRPARDLMTRAVTPPGASGRVFGFVSTGLNVGNALTPVLLGWLVDIGYPQAVFYALAVFLLLAITTVGVVRRPAPEPSAAE